MYVYKTLIANIYNIKDYSGSGLALRAALSSLIHVEWESQPLLQGKKKK